MRVGESLIHEILERTPGESEELSRPERTFCVKEFRVLDSSRTKVVPR